MARWAAGVVFVVAAVLGVGGYRVLSTGAAPAKTLDAQEQKRDEFAADREPAAIKPLPFDGKRAMTYLEAICKIGPRISGTEGMRKQQELLYKHFESCGAKVRYQRFTAEQVSQRRPVEMANLIASWHPERPRRVIVCSHYDTRPIADQEPDPRDWHRPFLSANDGGSGVALLMEMANHRKGLATEVGVDFVLFDGEEYIFDHDRDQYFFGSKQFARVYKRNQERINYLGAVLLDMIGGKDAHIPAEQNSWRNARTLVQDLWRIALEQKCTIFQNEMGETVLDDHLALNEAGIPAVDLIDFKYPHWHRLTDVPANCSGESMEQVARVLSIWLQQAK
jgi:glutaminyl-peptide cyclotransferase